MPVKTRLDTLMVDRGLVPSRERARALILAGQISVDGQVVSKAGTPIRADARVEMIAPDHPWVSRGGVKLANALDVFQVSVEGRRALDVGASTGGFTDVLLHRGARDVVALDVGRGQLDWRLRTDPRVLVREGVNARALTAEDVPHLVDLVTIDVAFISLRHILPALPPVLTPKADIVALVKPQFEAGREEVGKGGVVRDSQIHERVCAEAETWVESQGWSVVGIARSPITGPEGNVEFLLGAIKNG